MGKDEFIKLAPMYYALGIAARLSELEDNEYLSAGVMGNDQSPGGFLGLLKIDSLLNQGAWILMRYQMIDVITDRFGPALLKKGPGFSAQFALMCGDKSSPFFKYSVAGSSGPEWLESALVSVNSHYKDLGLQPQDFENPDQAQEQFPLRHPMSSGNQFSSIDDDRLFGPRGHRQS